MTATDACESPRSHDARRIEPAAPRLIRTVDGQACCDPIWEDAYRRFESPEQEVRKIVTRLTAFGATAWRRDARIASLFCGRGGELMALEQLGFSNVVGVDLSEQLLQQYHGRFTCYIADCRNLPLGDSSQDFVLIQGGLHHLPTLPDDLHRTLREVHRVLAPDGRLAVVEPWRTAFLEIVHFGCRRSLARRLWPRLDALAVMIEHEERTYAQWLSRPREILDVVHQHFVPASLRIRWGKIALLAQKRYAGVDSDRGG